MSTAEAAFLALHPDRRAIVVRMSDSLTIRRDAQVEADLASLLPAFGTTTAAVKAALHQLAEQHRYWQRLDEVIAELELAGIEETDESRAWAEQALP